MDTCLPYIDEHASLNYGDRNEERNATTTTIQSQVQSLLEAEMKAMNTRINDAADQSPIGPPPSKLEGGMDTTRLRLDPPQHNSTSSTDWIKAVHNATAQLSHQSDRLVNLELMGKFGADAWRIHNLQLEGTLARLQEARKEQEHALLQLNQIRKMEQMKAGNTLHALESRWREAVNNSAQTSIASRRLEEELHELRDEIDRLEQATA